MTGLPRRCSKRRWAGRRQPGPRRAGQHRPAVWLLRCRRPRAPRRSRRLLLHVRVPEEPERQQGSPGHRRGAGGHRRDLGALLGHGPAHRHAAERRRRRRCVPSCSPDLPSPCSASTWCTRRSTPCSQLPERQLDRLGRVRQLRADLHREHLPVAIRNSFVWVIVVPAAAVLIGLSFATLADKLSRTHRVVLEVADLPARWRSPSSGRPWCGASSTASAPRASASRSA